MFHFCQVADIFQWFSILFQSDQKSKRADCLSILKTIVMIEFNFTQTVSNLPEIFFSLKRVFPEITIPVIKGRENMGLT